MLSTNDILLQYFKICNQSNLWKYQPEKKDTVKLSVKGSQNKLFIKRTRQCLILVKAIENKIR